MTYCYVYTVVKMDEYKKFDDVDKFLIYLSLSSLRDKKNRHLKKMVVKGSICLPLRNENKILLSSN